jgi:hypothetical protein
MSSNGIVPKVKSRAATITPRAVPRGRANKNKMKLQRQGQSLLHRMAHGAQKPKRIGPSRKTIGAAIIIPIVFQNRWQYEKSPNCLPGHIKNPS